MVSDTIPLDIGAIGGIFLGVVTFMITSLSVSISYLVIPAPAPKEDDMVQSFVGSESSQEDYQISPPTTESFASKNVLSHLEVLVCVYYSQNN